MFTWFFDTSGFVPRSQCGEWSTELIILAIVADIIIALAYYAIPIILYIYFRRLREQYSHSWILLLFAAFIFACGTTHAIDAMTYYYPYYRLLIAVDIITAILSISTACLLPKTINKIVDIESKERLKELNEKLEQEVTKRRESEERIRELNHELATQVQVLQNRIQLQGWISEKQVDLAKMKNIVVELRKGYAGTTSPTS
jgi:signal transduction histidine kinase